MRNKVYHKTEHGISPEKSFPELYSKKFFAKIKLINRNIYTYYKKSSKLERKATLVIATTCVSEVSCSSDILTRGVRRKSSTVLTNCSIERMIKSRDFQN